ncbi:hypothetical protein HDU76_008724 [Blyttiomyces sp. JEL0837]|nr:hypothetical protein HDU76_008724 [Blyttiomyces sp. JEL0837]
MKCNDTMPYFPPVDPTCPEVYIVKPGDTSYMIAKTLGLTLDELREYNPNVKLLEVIYPGQEICIAPLGTATVTPEVLSTDIPLYTGEAETAPPKQSDAANSSCLQTYTAQDGDICWSIASAFNITEDHLQNLNPSISCSSKTNAVKVGMELCVRV